VFFVDKSRVGKQMGWVFLVILFNFGKASLTSATKKSFSVKNQSKSKAHSKTMLALAAKKEKICLKQNFCVSSVFWGEKTFFIKYFVNVWGKKN
jgi:hypothetical protein